MPGNVQVRREKFQQLMVPLGQPDRNPPLPSAGYRSIYPYTRLYRFGQQPVERRLDGLWLENDYLSLLVAPELGGHLWRAVNCLTGKDLFHIPRKAGLINFSLRGAWYTGGIEFNFPNSHSVTTPATVPVLFRRSPGGGAAILAGNFDLAWRAGWCVSIRLEPGSSSIYFDVLLYNRSPLPLRYWWWINAALPADDSLEYVNATTEMLPHFVGRREHRSEPVGWPIHQGCDLRWYGQCAEPTSLFQLAGDGRWFGFYHHGSDQGVVRIGSSADAPGLKFWNSGMAEEGFLWGKLLTCGERFANTELQSGRPETQTDYGVLPPHCTLKWTEVWRPVWGLGGLSCASEAVAVHLAVDEQHGSNLRILADSERPQSMVLVQGSIPAECSCDLRADKPVELALPVVSDVEPLLLEVRAANGDLLLRWDRPGDQARRSVLADVLQFNTEHAPRPDEMGAEALALEAERFERFNLPDAARVMAEKALKLDPGHMAAHLALAWREVREGRYQTARQHSLAILRRNPRHEWAHAVLALATLRSGEFDRAEIEFERLAGQAYAASAYAWFHLAELRMRRGDWSGGSLALSRCLEREANHVRAHALCATALRHAGRTAEATLAAKAAHALAPLDPLVRCELWFSGVGPPPFGITRSGEIEPEMVLDLRPDEERCQDALEAACDYLACGLLEDARRILEPMVESGHPLAAYYLGYLAYCAGEREASEGYWQEAEGHSGESIFSFRGEDEAVLGAALRAHPDDALAHALLGMLEVYRRNPGRAMPHLERAADLRSNWDQPMRLLAIAEVQQGRTERAVERYWEALERNPSNPALYTELDELLVDRPEHSTERRRLWRYVPEIVLADDRACGRYLDALLEAGDAPLALERLASRTFYPEEGSSFFRDLHVEAHLCLALEALDTGSWQAAMDHAESAAGYPENLGLAEPAIRYDAPAHLLAALVYHRAGRPDQARRYVQRAVVERHRETNEAVYYSGLALMVSGRPEEAAACFQRLVEKSEQDLAWPDRDASFAHLLALLGQAGLAGEPPSIVEAAARCPRYRRKAILCARVAAGITDYTFSIVESMEANE